VKIVSAKHGIYVAVPMWKRQICWFDKTVILPEGQFLECHSAKSQFEDILKDIFSNLPFPAGTANSP
jgi:hypothetical protein